MNLAHLVVPLVISASVIIAFASIAMIYLENRATYEHCPKCRKRTVRHVFGEERKKTGKTHRRECIRHRCGWTSNT